MWLPLPLALWNGWQCLPILAGAALIVLVLLTGLFDGPGLRKGMPERFSMAPQADNKAAKRNEKIDGESGPTRIQAPSRIR